MKGVSPADGIEGTGKHLDTSNEDATMDQPVSTSSLIMWRGAGTASHVNRNICIAKPCGLSALLHGVPVQLDATRSDWTWHSSLSACPNHQTHQISIQQVLQNVMLTILSSFLL